MNDREKDFLILDAVSRINDEMVEQALQKRFKLWQKKCKRYTKMVISLVSVVTAAALIFGVFAYFSLFGNDSVPIYEGMTVGTTPQSVLSAHYGSAMELSLERSSYQGTFSSLSAPLTPTNSVISAKARTDGLNDHGRTDNTSQEPSSKRDPLPTFGQTYYAMPNEDIYIYVYLTNPAGYEILSFTLNGVKYSSYMFEVGSDMELLILKYNVGNVAGLQEYTIDAIKYVDGEQIKDVEMKGDQTVRVMVNGGDNNLSLNVNAEFDTIRYETVWSSAYPGRRQLISAGIYENDALLRSISPSARSVQMLPLGKRLILKIVYMDGENPKTITHVFETPKQSEGFILSDGIIVGAGTCTDSILYIDAPIGPRVYATVQEKWYIKAVYCSGNVTSIGDDAFWALGGAEKIVMSEGVEEIGEYSFAECHAVKSITIPASVRKIGLGAFDLDYWDDNDSTDRAVDVWYGGTKQQWMSIDWPERGSNQVKGTPTNAFNGADFVIHCTDGVLQIK